MTRPTESILCSILIALVLSICGPTAWAGDDAANGPAIADDNEPNPPAARDRNASDKNVLAGPRTGADAVKRAGRGFSGKDKGRGAAVMQILGQLNLSEKQLEQVRKTMKEGQAARKEFRKKHGSELKKLREQMRSARSPRDRKKMRELAASQKSLMQKPGGRLAMKKQLAKILTPPQMKQFEQKMRELHRKNRSAQNKTNRGKGPAAAQGDKGVKDGTKLDI